MSLTTVLIGHLHFWTTPEEIGERQPIQDRRGQFTLALDGRLDNRSELIKLLELDSTAVEEISDARIALTAYLNWGAGCFEHFLGPFSLILYDGSKGRLLCARDHLGSRTLFYHVNSQHFVAASEEAGVLAFPGIDSQFDKGGLAEFLAVDVYRRSGTLFKNISELPRATLLSVDPENVRRKTFWSPQPASIRYRTDQQYAEHFLELLDRSVSCRMRAPTPPAVLMSGGYDSTAVAALAARELKRRRPQQKLQTVSWIFDGLKECDESRYIQAMRRHLGLETTLLRADSYWPLHPSTFQRWNPNRPEGNPYRVLKQAAYQAASGQGSLVLLTGTVAENLFTHEGAWLGDLITEKRWPEVLRLIAREAQMRGLTGTFSSTLRLLRRAIKVRKGSTSQGLIKPAWLTDNAWKLLQPVEEVALDGWRRPTQFERLFGRGSQVSVTAEIPNSNRCQIELRHPFRDLRLTEFCLGIPAYQLYRPVSFKYLLRRALKEKLPEEIRLRRRNTTLLPFYTYGLEKERSRLESVLSRRDAAWEPYVSRSWLSKSFQAFPNSPKDGSEAVVPWLCFSLQMWIEQFERKSVQGPTWERRSFDKVYDMDLS